MRQLNVAVVGTGAVGRAMLQVLEERNFPVGRLRLLATSRSAGKEIQFKGQTYQIEETTPQSFAGIDLALFAGGDASKEFAHEAVARGTVVIDNGSAFRMDPGVPLVIPEVNPGAVHQHHGIIANPNCSTIQMVVALKPLDAAATITRVVVSTYQAVSGAGQEAMDELVTASQQVLAKQKPEHHVFPHPIAYNILPHIDVFLESGYSKEEMKMINETKKIMDRPDLRITATAVRVPVFNGHSESVNIETKKKISAAEARAILQRSPGIVVEDDPAAGVYPLPSRASGRDEVFVGRIREDLSIERGLNFWVVADNLRKGAATNAIQIAELMMVEGLL